MSVLVATASLTSSTPSIALPSLFSGIPSIKAQWEQARWDAAARKCREDAIRQAEELAVLREKEATQHAEETARKIEEQASRTVEAELEQLRLQEIETTSAVEAQSQFRELAKETAREALEEPEKIRVAEFPQIIADAKTFDLDKAKITEAERVYRDKALAGFVAERAEERLRKAAVSGRADKGARPSPEAQFVVRAVPLPLPVLVTTRIISGPGKEEPSSSQAHDLTAKIRCLPSFEAEFEMLESKLKKNEGGCQETPAMRSVRTRTAIFFNKKWEDADEEERSTCVDSDREVSVFPSPIVSAAASDSGGEVCDAVSEEVCAVPL